MKMETSQIFVLVYVDDLVIQGTKEDGVKWVKDKLSSLFKVTNLGEICY